MVRKPLKIINLKKIFGTVELIGLAGMASLEPLLCQCDPRHHITSKARRQQGKAHSA